MKDRNTVFAITAMDDPGFLILLDEDCEGLDDFLENMSDNYPNWSYTDIDINTDLLFLD